MSRKQSKLEYLHEYSEDPAGKDSCTLIALESGFAQRAKARDMEINELIARGWGDTDPRKIPNNWQKTFGPDRILKKSLKPNKTSR